MDDATAKIERQLSLINVPSKGRYYEGNKSYFLIRHLSCVEENILANNALMDSEEGIKLVLNSLMVDDFDVEALLPGDVQAISMYLYSTAYGDKIDMDVHCPGCGAQEKKDVLISEFKIKEVESWPDENRRMPGVLPVSKFSFSVRIPTFFEEFRFKRNLENNDTHLDRLSFLLEDINGVKGVDMIREFAEGLPIQDSRFLRKFIDKNTPGVDTHVDHQCGECHQEYKVHISGGHNFLRLPESYANSMLEEVYLVAKHGENISWDSAMHMSTSQRKWVLQRIKKDVNARNDQDSKGAKSIQSKSRRFKK